MTDDELFDRVRAGDPAVDLPPIPSDRARRLLEDTMTSTHTPQTASTRNPLGWLVAAAAVVLLAGVAFWAFRPDGATTPAATDESPSGDAPSVLALTAPGGEAYQARCMAPTPETLGLATVAFRGEVSGISDGQVTLVPSEWYAGEEADEVTVEAPSADLGRLIQTVDFELGGDYLVAAQGETVMICGLSAPASDELVDTYEKAFAG